MGRRSLVHVAFRVNGEEVSLLVPPAKTLLRVLREDLGLTGAKPGCEAGECGACTVLLDGEPVTSCLVLVSQVDGRDVVTIEGLAKDGGLDPIQESFIEEGALQCGYCTPGFIMAAKGLLNRNKSPTVDAVKKALEGNVCRCGAYPRIIKAVLKAAGRGARG